MRKLLLLAALLALLAAVAAGMSDGHLRPQAANWVSHPTAGFSDGTDRVATPSGWTW